MTLFLQKQQVFKTLFAVLLFLQCNTMSFAQTAGAYEMSKIVLSSEDSLKKAIHAGSDNCYLTLNVVNGDFMMRTDLAALRTNDMAIDTLLVSAAKEQVLVFKGNINQPMPEYNKKQNDEKIYDMTGVLTFNGLSLPCVAQYDPINLADKSDAKNYRMDFILSLETNKLKIKGWESLLNKSFTLEVLGGKINIQN